MRSATVSLDAAVVQRIVRGFNSLGLIGNVFNKGDVSNSQYVFFIWKNGQYAETKL